MGIAEDLRKERIEVLNHLEALHKDGNMEGLDRLAQNMLRENMEDPAAMFYMARVLCEKHRDEMALILLQKCAAIRPKNPDIWSLMGGCLDRMYFFEEAIQCYKKAIEINDKDAVSYGSIASAYVGLSNPALALEYANKGLEIDAENLICKVNAGFANLMLGKWADGWPGYDLLLGHPGAKRKQIHYGGMVKWDGSDVKLVVTHAEQGIGDSIMFASCVPDALKHTEKLVIDCDPKLEGLFKRSFPDCDVYGTRHDMSPKWTSKYEVDASIAMGSLCGLFRLKDEDFPKTPYLKADPERRTMYRALLGSWGRRPKIGISWTGGNMHGGFRKLELDRLQKLVEAFPNVDWVSLQYKDSPTYGLPIHVLKYAAETHDYEDTAALVSELDLVISVPQAVVHLAGGLGKECWCLVPDATRWIYGIEGDQHQWYGSVRLYRDWDNAIDNVIRDLSLRYAP